jgi:hypothetical protein
MQRAVLLLAGLAATFIIPEAESNQLRHSNQEAKVVRQKGVSRSGEFIESSERLRNLDQKRTALEEFFSDF